MGGMILRLNRLHVVVRVVAVVLCGVQTLMSFVDRGSFISACRVGEAQLLIF